MLSEQVGLVAADRRPEQSQRGVRRDRIRQQIRNVSSIASALNAPARTPTVPLKVATA